MLEATGGKGVAYNQWCLINKYIGPDKFYKQCVFRKVDFNRSD